MKLRKVALIVLGIQVAAFAEDRNWNNTNGGPFHTPGNWSQGSVPGPSDRSIFDLSSGGYAVTFTAGVDNEALEVANDIVTLELGSSTYSLSSAVLVGIGPGTSSQLTIHGTAVEAMDFIDVARDQGTGLLQVEGGASLTTYNGLGVGIGISGTDGTLVVSGVGSTLSLLNCCGLRVGEDSGNTGRVTIENDAVATFGPGSHQVGISGGEGFLVVQGGAELTLTNGSGLQVAVGNGDFASIGHVVLSSGSRLQSDGQNLLAVGGPNTFGELSVSDAGTLWEAPGGIEVGLEGMGALSIDDGGVVESLYGGLAGLETGVASVLVSGVGSTWTMDGVFEIGVRGEANVLVNNGAVVSCGPLPMAIFPGSTGWLTVTGTGSALQSGGFVVVGDGGASALLEVQNGATVGTTPGFQLETWIGNQPGCVGTLAVDGTGSRYDSDDIIAIGRDGGTGYVTITNGGVATAGYFTILGVAAGAHGELLIDGGGSMYETGGIHGDHQGTGLITVSNGGQLIASAPNKAIEINRDHLLIMGAGSTATAARFHISAASPDSALLTVQNGGVAHALANSTVGHFSDSRGSVVVTGMGSEFIVNGILDLGIGFLGPSSAMLTVSDGGRVSAGTHLGISDRGRVNGDGEIAALVFSGGVVQPGLSTGILTIAGAYTQAGSGTFGIEVGGITLGTQYDQLAVTGAASLAGRLEIDLISGFVPSAGDSFDIMTYGSVGGRFETIISDNLPAGLHWALDYNPTVLTLIACDPIADPSCDDCNLNGVLDGEDIANMTSNDVNMDGIPDECTNFVAACFPPTDQWSCFDNWDLPGNQYPDDVNSASGIFVTLNQTDDVTLDVDATIPGLRVIDDAVLHVTGGNLAVYGGNETLVEGEVLVANAQTINIPNARLTLAPGGVYQKDPDVAAVSSAMLNADGLYLVGNACENPPCAMGSEFDLSEELSATINGSVTIDGRLSSGVCPAAREGETLTLPSPLVRERELAGAAALGGYTPPILSIRHSAWIYVSQDVSLYGAGALGVDSLPVSMPPVDIGGNFNNYSNRPDCFSCRNGEFMFSGVSQTFEVAGTDEGPLGSVDGAEFVMGVVEVAANTQVTFQDRFDNNGVGPSTCSEALYVERLTINANSTITLDNCRVYYEVLEQDPMATVNLVGCAQLLSVVPPPAPTAEPGGASKGRAVAVVVPPPAVNRGPGPVTSLRVTLTKLNQPRLCCTDPTGTSCSATPCNVSSHCAAVPGGNQTCAHQVAAGSPDFSAMENNIRYVNSFTFPAAGGSLDCADDGPPFNTSYKCATLGCEPEYRDWASDLATPGPGQPNVPGLLFISGDAIVPSSTLEVSQIFEVCGDLPGANTCVAASAPLAVGTAGWGDITSPGFGPPDGKSDVLDIPAVTNKLKGVPTFFSEPRTWLKQRDPTPNLDAITVLDLSDVVDGVLAKPYPASRTIDGCPHD